MARTFKHYPERQLVGRDQTAMNMLYVIVIVVCVAAAFYWYPQLAATIQSLNMLGERSHAVDELEALPRPPARTFSTGDLAGKRLGSLFATYLGKRQGSRLKETITVDFTEVLIKLWERKALISPNNEVVQAFGYPVIREYIVGDPGRISLHDFQAEAGSTGNLVWDYFDWKRLGELYYKKLPEQDRAIRLNLLKAVSKTIAGRDLIAYGETELLPGYDGKFNRDFLDLLLRNAGREFLERVPAEGDYWASFGFFQFTSNAVFADGDEHRGASRANLALPRILRIPSTVTMLRDGDHFRAAYLFAVHNLAVFIGGLNGKQLATLAAASRSRHEDLVEFIACAHHSPSAAYRAGRQWLDAGAMKPYAAYATSSIRDYALKTKNNYEAL